MTQVELANFERLIKTWMRAYSVTLKAKKAKEARLNELRTWDKARSDNQLEHTAKIAALENLILINNPYTINN